MSSGEGKGTVTLNRGSGTSCIVDLFGASVISWKVSGEEKLFIGGKTVFDNKTPLVGGIPIVFPKFADWENSPFHGFARVCLWKIEEHPKTVENGDISAQFALKDTPYTRQFWDHSFILKHEVILRQNQLVSRVYVTNPSPSASFDFDLLLHTYVKTPDVSRIEITGFQNTRYVDKTKQFREFPEHREAITIDHYTDSIYKNTADCHVISKTMSGKSVKIVKTNYPDTVVWNPGTATVKNFPELEENDYKYFVCVEAGHVAKPVHLPPGQTYQATQVMEIV